MQPTILIVDDDAGHRSMLRTVLRGWGYDTQEADDGSTAVDKVRERPFDAVLMDVRMARMGGIEALGGIKEYNPAVPVLIMTAYSSVETAVEAIRAGAYDYLTKPLDFDVLRMTLERMLEHVRLREENRQLRQKLDDGHGIIGRSAPMRDLVRMVVTVAPSDATVLITGESGTGKELVARAVHAAGPRSAKDMVTVNCAALSEHLLESELFGHEKGAFTGADRRREGRFVQADGGSLFLDEIGEVPPPMQVKLLRAIQQGEVQRVGSDAMLHVDVRVIAATNRDLRAEVEAGRFREDLYYRLNVINLTVPPLRARMEDVPLLAQHFLEHFAERNRKQLKGFAPQAMDLLMKHAWPGNVRELENAVERAVILCPGDFITPRELPLALTSGPDEEGAPELRQAVSLAGRALEDIEREAILATLDDTGGNKSETARRLGITRATLHNKLKKYGME